MKVLKGYQKLMYEDFMHNIVKTRKIKIKPQKAPEGFEGW